MKRGERFFSTPHKLHLYQRLLRLGWPHARVTSLYAGLALGSAAAALAYPAASDAVRVVLLAAVALPHVVLAVVVMRLTNDPAPARPDSLTTSRQPG
jgi:hypothetical protein